MKDFKTGSDPLPSDPWDTAFQYGRHQQSAEPTGRPWVSPGPPPGTVRRTPRWAVAFIAVGVVLAVSCWGKTVIDLAAGGHAPVGGIPVSPTAPERAVVVFGTCENKIIGEYGLLASVTAENQATVPAVGRIWARWTLTGSEPVVKSKDVTLTPGQRVTMHVDDPIDAEHWFRIKSCDYGWTAGKTSS